MGGAELVGAEPGAGFVEEAKHDAAGAFIVAEFGGKDVGVAERFTVFEVVGHVVAAKEIPPPLAPDRPEDFGHVAGGLVEKLVGGEDAVGVETGFHADVDAAELFEVESAEAVGEIFVFDNDQAVGFLEVGGEFGEEGVGGDSDAAGEAGGEFAGDGVFDALGDFFGSCGITFFAEEPAPHLVDGADFLDREISFNALFDAVVIVGVFGGGGLDADKFRAHIEGIPDFRSGADPVFLGLVAGGDDGAGVAFGLGDAHRLAAEPGVFGLFDAGEVAVEVYIEPSEGELWPKW